MMFVDSNIAMYLFGAPGPSRQAAVAAVEMASRRGHRLVTSAEVFQEVLYRYHRLGRLDVAAAAFEWLRETTDEVYPVELEDVRLAAQLLRKVPRLSARDAIHAAVMQRREVDQVLSFDTDFDLIPGIERVS